MRGAVRISDYCTGHDACPPRHLKTGSPDVTINDKLANRATLDLFALHGCEDHEIHTGVVLNGSPDVFVNDRPLGRIGDIVSCGGFVATASENVFVN